MQGSAFIGSKTKTIIVPELRSVLFLVSIYIYSLFSIKKT